jgi:hypothetical protein
VSPAVSKGSELRVPEWFGQFMADRAIRKPSAHTTKAYRRDFEAIAVHVCGTRSDVGDLTPQQLTKDATLGVRGLRGRPCSGIYSAMLVDVEHDLHLPLHRGALAGQPDATDRSAQGSQGAGYRHGGRIGHGDQRRS